MLKGRGGGKKDELYEDLVLFIGRQPFYMLPLFHCLSFYDSTTGKWAWPPLPPPHTHTKPYNLMLSRHRFPLLYFRSACFCRWSEERPDDVEHLYLWLFNAEGLPSTVTALLKYWCPWGTLQFPMSKLWGMKNQSQRKATKCVTTYNCSQWSRWKS